VSGKVEIYTELNRVSKRFKIKNIEKDENKELIVYIYIKLCSTLIEG